MAGAPIGNTNAAKAKIFGDAMRKAITQDDKKRLAKGIEVVLDLAESGERWALEMIRDTLDGKPKQQIEGGGENGEFVFQAIQRTIIDAAKDE